ncbi:dienelactone hydrolase family protein [Xylophilus sp. GOD-11R]|uniref:dienelactone hydrolase family protein n=1 Tax=Xylophilus sp. GOD-11R TaxID=3089814 RepID=UPI00298C04C0|nr:dienelactone hydrolase family protein [Xylophilus sp. GOD-11R]WPB58417.1 dienelactone hydrolase family protein [Xylophilus sp. GOD-11R]
MPDTSITIRTRDGDCPAHFLTPADEGRWPAVVFFGDAGGMRPAMVAMARRLADAGYAVLLPDPFYRFGPYEPLVPVEVFAGDVAAILGPLMATSGNPRAAEDTPAFLAWLDAHEQVDAARLGAVGFCMGSGMALTAAGTVPSRFAAVASFHGGHLATDDEASPHLLADRLQAEVYIAAADQDASYPPAMAERLENALAEAGVDCTSETYVGAAHGWMVLDFPVYDPVAAEHGWRAMLALFERRLRG